MARRSACAASPPRNTWAARRAANASRRDNRPSSRSKSPIQACVRWRTASNSIDARRVSPAHSPTRNFLALESLPRIAPAARTRIPGDPDLVNALHALRAEPAPLTQPQPALREYVAKAVRRYLHDLGECDAHNLYDVV